jgi:hypothetical protein
MDGFEDDPETVPNKVNAEASENRAPQPPSHARKHRKTHLRVTAAMSEHRFTESAVPMSCYRHSHQPSTAARKADHYHDTQQGRGRRAVESADCAKIVFSEFTRKLSELDGRPREKAQGKLSNKIDGDGHLNNDDLKEFEVRKELRST